MKLTGISRKQAGVIYRNYKLGNLDLTEKQISLIYDYSDFSSNWAQPCEYDMVSCLREAIDAIFAKDMDGAAAKLDRFFSIHSRNFVAC